MPNFDTNDMALAIIDQAIQNARLTQMNENLTGMLAAVNAENQQLRQQLEAKEVAAQIAEEAPEADTAT